MKQKSCFQNKVRFNSINLLDIGNILDKNAENIFFKNVSTIQKNDSIKSNSRHKTIGLQKSKEEKMKYFLKEMNLLKNQSIMKKNDRQKRQIYIAKLRKEAEERKKEEEKRLEALGL